MSKTVSPYKGMNQARQNYVGYKSVSSLQPNKAYKIYQIEHTTHEKFGPGELCYIMDKIQNKKWRVQLPSKFLRQIKSVNPKAIDIYIKDIRRGQHPFLVYRRTLDDNSFELDIMEHDQDIVNHYLNKTDVPELENSMDLSTPPISPNKDGEVDTQITDEVKTPSASPSSDD